MLLGQELIIANEITKEFHATTEKIDDTFLWVSHKSPFLITGWTVAEKKNKTNIFKISDSSD